ncbi:MAG TPA: hypothetical protein HPP76_02265 [Desulfuromonadales bacterium]|nr:hypothetical protein [Desulfuromonadales bacterium]
MPLNKLKSDEHFTYADYLTWDDGKRWELIAGQAFCMSPAPGIIRRFAQSPLFLVT